MGKRGLSRTSCENCRRKKVRCDLPERTAIGGSACSACSTRGFLCELKPDPVGAPRGFDGKQDSQKSSTRSSLASTAAAATAASSVATPSSASNLAALTRSTSHQNAEIALPDHPYLPSNGPPPQQLLANGRAKTTHEKPPPGVFGVPGLTWPMLWQSADRYFATAGRCNPSLNQNRYRKRLEAYFKCTVEGSIEVAGGEESSLQLSPLLVLAVTATGIPHTNVPRKHELQHSIVRAAHALSSEPDFVEVHGVDGIQALLILADILNGPDGDPIFAPSPKPDPLRIDPFSREALPRLAAHMNLHCMPSTDNTSGNSSEERRNTLWHVFTLDAWSMYRSFHLPLQEIEVSRPPDWEWTAAGVALGCITREMFDMCWTAQSRKTGVRSSDVVHFLKSSRAYGVKYAVWCNVPAPDDADEVRVRKLLIRMLWLNSFMLLESFARTVGLENTTTTREGNSRNKDASEVRAMLRSNTITAFKEIVEVVDLATKADAMSSHIAAFRNITVGCTMWCFERMERSLKQERHLSAFPWLRECAVKLMEGIKSTSCIVDTPSVLQQLQENLRKLDEGHTKATSTVSTSHTSATAPASADPLALLASASSMAASSTLSSHAPVHDPSFAVFNDIFPPSNPVHDGSFAHAEMTQDLWSWLLDVDFYGGTPQQEGSV